MTRKKFILLLAGFCLFLFQATWSLKAQDPARFKSRVDELVNAKYDFDHSKKLVVFTGSSSVRMWEDVASYFPEYNVINNGFGGSHFSDLLHYYDELIFRFKPDLLFIYEGDNDLESGKNPLKLLQEAKTLVNRIHKDLPATRIILISPKPSIARWHLKNQYELLNKNLEKMCKRKNFLEFANVWNAMLDENGEVIKDIFLEDNLHMNKKGYDIWGKVIGNFLKQ